MLAVICGWVLFRAETLTHGLYYLRAMFVPTASPYNPRIFLNPVVWTALAAGFLFCGVLSYIMPRLKAILMDDSKVYVWEVLVMPILLILCIICLVSSTYNPFIYFRF